LPKGLVAQAIDTFFELLESIGGWGVLMFHDK
jgi:hypothetical protein